MATREQQLAARAARAGTLPTQYSPTVNQNQPTSGLGYNMPVPAGNDPNYIWTETDKQWEYNWANFNRDTAHMTWEEKNTVAQADRAHQELMAQLKQQYDISMAEIAASRGIASADAQSRVAVADRNAQATIEAAQIAAEASKYDADTRLQIARETNQVAREGLQLQGAQYRAEEVGRPSEWPEQVAFDVGWQPQQASQLHRGVLEGLDKAIAGIGGEPLPVASSAIVGEPGPNGEARPELATATPYGTEIMPINTPAKARLATQKQLTGMATGGFIPRPGEGGYAARQAAQRNSTSNTTTRPRGGISRNLLSAQGAGAGYTPPVSEMGLWGSQYQNPRRQKTSILQQARSQGAAWAVAPTIPDVSKWLPGTGATGGRTIPAAEPPVGLPTTPGSTGPGTATDQLIADLMKPNQAAFGNWTGPTTNPEIGVTQDVRHPSSYNLQEWNTLTYQRKAYLAGLWRSLKMIAGETEQEKMANAEAAIRSSAWTGGAPAVPVYGAW